MAEPGGVPPAKLFPGPQTNYRLGTDDQFEIKHSNHDNNDKHGPLHDPVIVIHTLLQY